MRKIFAFAVALMLLLSLSSAAFSKVQHKGILLAKIVVIEDVPVFSSVTIKNNRELDFSNGKVVLSIPELGARASGRVSVGDGSSETELVLLDLPESSPSGDYWLRVVVTNEDVTRIRHRLITIE